MSTSHKLVRAATIPVGLAAALLVAGPAQAHVTISPAEAPAGGYAVLTVSVPHGCEEAPTREVAIKMPEDVIAVTPTRNPLWEVEKVMADLAEPVTDSHGNLVTERVDQVVYTTDDPLPADERDAFELSLKVPEVAGQTLVFPIIQSCTGGAEEAWVEIAEPGTDAEPEKPAPTLTVTEASGDAHGSTDGTTAAASTSEDGNVEGLAIAGLVAGIAALIVGLFALVAVRRRA